MKLQIDNKSPGRTIASTLYVDNLKIETYVSCVRDDDIV